MDVNNINVYKNQQEIVDNWLDKFGSDYVSVKIEKTSWKRGGCFTDEHWLRKSECPEKITTVIQKHKNCLPKLDFATNRVPQYPCSLDNKLIEEAIALRKSKAYCSKKIEELGFKQLKCKREISVLEQRSQTGDLSSVRKPFLMTIYKIKYQFLETQLSDMDIEVKNKEQEILDLDEQLGSIIKIFPNEDRRHFTFKEEDSYIEELEAKNVIREEIGGERFSGYGVADCLMDEMQPEDKKINNQLAIHYQNLVKIGISEKDAFRICSKLRAKVIVPFYRTITVDATPNKASRVASSIFVLKGNGSQISRNEHLLAPFENDGKFCSIDFLKDEDIVIIGPEKAFEKCKEFPVYKNLIEGGRTIVFVENLTEEQKNRLGIPLQEN